ncbi:hypothetical protein E2R51_01945 [Jeotgalibacillus sp. S-D1]|uniref:hypothetical protein n=1 Tax=Jeotgalibacillus sp. S-D1 TaxID=2552189 RepID=UPI001059AAE0|nr:hypothetical protein [Jeotgalibacillus sp. S-D1]TDL34502.1 hypothetical protein E2R51_01945 [Jeotgalibacillus sp. S-D1]
MELIIMAILAGIVSFIGNQKKKSEEQTAQKSAQNSKQHAPSQSANTQPPSKRDRVKNARDAFDSRAKELKQEYDRQKVEVERSKPQRLPRVENADVPTADIDLTQSAGRASSNRPVSQRNKSAAGAPKVEELPIKKGLTEKDLVNGIVMAEILGSPRSKQRHSTRMTR